MDRDKIKKALDYLKGSTAFSEKERERLLKGGENILSSIEGGNAYSRNSDGTYTSLYKEGAGKQGHSSRSPFSNKNNRFLTLVSMLEDSGFYDKKEETRNSNVGTEPENSSGTGNSVGTVPTAESGVGGYTPTIGDVPDFGVQLSNNFRKAAENKERGVPGKESNNNTKQQTQQPKGNETLDVGSGEGEEFTDDDFIDLLSLGSDVVGLGMSFIPGMNVVAAGTGLAGTGVRVWNDVRKGRLGDNAGGHLLDAGLNLATAIPFVGSGAKAAQIARNTSKVLSLARKGLKGMMQSYGALSTVEGLSNIPESIKYIDELSEKNITDWRSEDFRKIADIINSIQAGRNAVRTGRNVVAKSPGAERLTPGLSEQAKRAVDFEQKAAANNRQGMTNVFGDNPVRNAYGRAREEMSAIFGDGSYKRTSPAQPKDLPYQTPNTFEGQLRGYFGFRQRETPIDVGAQSPIRPQLQLPQGDPTAFTRDPSQSRSSFQRSGSAIRESRRSTGNEGPQRQLPLQGDASITITNRYRHELAAADRKGKTRHQSGPYTFEKDPYNRWVVVEDRSNYRTPRYNAGGVFSAIGAAGNLIGMLGEDFGMSGQDVGMVTSALSTAGTIGSSFNNNFQNNRGPSMSPVQRVDPSRGGIGVDSLSRLSSRLDRQIVPSYESGGKFRRRLIEDIKRNEGYRDTMYYDTEGIPTIGYGFNLQRPDAREKITSLGYDFDKVLSGEQRLREEDSEKLLDSVLDEIEGIVESRYPSFNEYPEDLKSVLVDLTYNMGPNRFNDKTWRNFHDALGRMDYEAMARSLEGSKYGRQTKGRAERNQELLRALENTAPSHSIYSSVPQLPTDLGNFDASLGPTNRSTDPFGSRTNPLLRAIDSTSGTEQDSVGTTRPSLVDRVDHSRPSIPPTVSRDVRGTTGGSDLKLELGEGRVPGSKVNSLDRGNRDIDLGTVANLASMLDSRIRGGNTTIEAMEPERVVLNTRPEELNTSAIRQRIINSGTRRALGTDLGAATVMDRISNMDKENRLLDLSMREEEFNAGARERARAASNQAAMMNAQSRESARRFNTEMTNNLNLMGAQSAGAEYNAAMHGLLDKLDSDRMQNNYLDIYEATQGRKQFEESLVRNPSLGEQYAKGNAVDREKMYREWVDANIGRLRKRGLFR